MNTEMTIWKQNEKTKKQKNKTKTKIGISNLQWLWLAKDSEIKYYVKIKINHK